jgi:hypothetical protein
MATLKCLACGQDNNAGEETCTSCSASLDLKLCSACDAIHPAGAGRCPNCGVGTPLASAWVISSEPGRGMRAAVWVVPVLTVGTLLSFFYGSGIWQAPQAVVVAPAVAAPLLPAPAPSAPEPEIRELKIAPGSAAAPRGVPRVTHTRTPENASAGGATAVR